MNEPVTSWPLPSLIDRAFEQSLSEPLRQPAMDLAFDQSVVEHVAGIVDRAIGDKFGVAGVGIDLDLGDMAAVRKRLRRVDGDLGVEVFRDLAALLHLAARAPPA